MIEIKIDDKWCKADVAVSKRMQEYYDSMVKFSDELIALKAKALEVRDAQKAYFSTRDQQTLRRSKALEMELDDMLAGRKKPAPQAELWK